MWSTCLLPRLDLWAHAVDAAYERPCIILLIEIHKSSRAPVFVSISWLILKYSTWDTLCSTANHTNSVHRGPERLNSGLSCTFKNCCSPLLSTTFIWTWPSLDLLFQIHLIINDFFQVYKKGDGQEKSGKTMGRKCNFGRNTPPLPFLN